ncbi:MAG: hypothetical protein WD431_00495, partial [Cyclobacteriaceae bacterium]
LVITNIHEWFIFDATTFDRHFALNKNPSKKVIRKGIKSQLQYLRRNVKTIEKMLGGFEVFPLNQNWSNWPGWHSLV